MRRQDIDPEEVIRSGLEDIEAAIGQIEHEAARIAQLGLLPTPEVEWRLTPTTRLEVSRGILAKIWKRRGIAVVGQIEDDVEGSGHASIPAALKSLYGLDAAAARALLEAIRKAAAQA